MKLQMLSARKMRQGTTCRHDLKHRLHHLSSSTMSKFEDPTKYYVTSLEGHMRTLWSPTLEVPGRALSKPKISFKHRCPAPTVHLCHFMASSKLHRGNCFALGDSQKSRQHVWERNVSKVLTHVKIKGYKQKPYSNSQPTKKCPCW